MKIELKSREGSVYKKLCNSVSEANSDTELIVPDSLEDILRILSCRRQCRIREKNVGQDTVSVSGEIDVTVMYIPETGDGVRVVGTTIPFEINFSAPGADSTSSAVTKLLALNADAKAVNPRKILISISTVMELSCYKYSDVCWFEPPENAPDKLYFKTSELKCKSIVLVSEKTLSVEDELDVPEQLSGGDFVRAFSSIRLSTSEVVGTKLVVKGSAEIEAIYLVSGVPQTARFSLPFSQLFTMPDGCTDPEVIACDMITGQYFEAFDGKLSADIRAAIQIICLQDQSRSYICDAYSCKKELALSGSELCCLTEINTVSTNCSTTVSYNSDYGVEAVISATAYAACPEISETEVLIQVTAELIYKDREGELRSCKLRGKAQYLPEDGRRPDKIHVAAVSVSASAKGDGLSADICVVISARYLNYDNINMISEVDETELERERPSAALYMCRCTDGDLWTLAKKYGSDTELIKQINEIEEVPTDRLLLIPVV